MEARCKSDAKLCSTCAKMLPSGRTVGTYRRPPLSNPVFSGWAAVKLGSGVVDNAGVGSFCGVDCGDVELKTELSLPLCCWRDNDLEHKKTIS